MNQDNEAAPEVWAKIKAQPLAMMTTIHDGELISRPMAAHGDPAEHAIYFVSRLESGKTSDIGTTSPVNLSFSDPGNSTFISVAGRATVSQDREKLRELWDMWSEAWLPDGPDSPDTALITVEPDDAVIWNNDSSRLVRLVKHVAAVVRQSPPDVGHVRKVDL